MFASYVIDDNKSCQPLQKQMSTNIQECTSLTDCAQSINDDSPAVLYTMSHKESWFSRVFGFASFFQLLCGVYNEALSILYIAIPMALTQLCTAVLDFEDLYFVGKLGSHHMAAAALGGAYALCLSYAASGLASALDTLISQSYGAKQYKMIGVAGNRALLITSVACIPIAVLYWFSAHIFLLARQDPLIANLAGTYVRYMLPGLLPIVLYRTLTSYLVNQDMQKYPMIISLSSLIINLIFGYLLVFGVGYKGLGFIGAPIATSLTRIVQLLSLVAVIIVKKLYRKSWHGLQIKESLHWRGVVQFLKLGIPGMLMDALDIWVFEGTAIPAGILSPASLAAHSVILDVYLIAFMIPLGVSIGGSVRVGYSLGAGQPKRAKFSCIVTMLLCIGIQGMTCVAVLLLRNYIGIMFTRDPDVLVMIAKTLPIAISFGIFDSLNQACGGTLKGIGKQFFGFLATLFAYWVLGLPLGTFFAFYCKLGLIGLWTGLAIGALFVSMVTFLSIVLLVNWEKESQKAIARSATTPASNVTENENPAAVASPACDKEAFETTLLLGPSVGQPAKYAVIN